MKDMIRIYLADTYALVELTRGRPSYLPYADALLLTTEHNIMELYYILLKDHGEEVADKYVAYCSLSAVSIPLHVMKKAMQFKFKHAHEHLSYTDCMGYALAQARGIRFLTGDKKFYGKENVEYVR